MVRKSSRKTAKRARSLRTKSLSGKHAHGVKGGLTITKSMDSASVNLSREALVGGEGKHVKIN